MKRSLPKIAAVLAVLLGVAALAIPAWLKRGSERVADEVAARLSDALEADCRVGSAKVLSTREVELFGVACVMDKGPAVGFGIGRAAARFSAPPLGGSLPPIEEVTVADLDVRLRDLPERAPAAGDDDDSSTDVGDLSHRLETEVHRFFEFTVLLDSGFGGAQVPALRDRLTDGGSVRVDRAVLGEADGTVVVSDVHAVVERTGLQLDVAVAAEPARGGVLAFDGTLSDAGLGGARIRLEAVPIAPELSKAAGDSVDVRAGSVSGELQYNNGGWAADVGLLDIDVQARAVGKDWLPLPTIRGRGTLVPDADAGTLDLREGRWEVAGVGGGLEANLGPLGPDAGLRLVVDGQRLALGQLMGELPEELMPASYAEEIQGTADLTITFGGPLHRRSEWDLDWESDFSRILLASGELAQEVARLRGPFRHTFPTDPPTTRVLGPEDDSFVPLNEISRHLAAAVVSTEDSGFFVHSGFEEASLKEAVLENLREGEGRGGSTITQQLAKNLFLSGERTLARKLKEAVIAWRLESDLPKERILEIYLNIAEWGPGLFGARDAADHYFNRTPRVLRPEEAAFLASMLPSPIRYHGYYHSPRGLTQNRYSMVQDILRSMHRMGRLGGRDYHLARGEPIELAGCRSN
ncbi:MAG: hypothetical protein GY898_17135 [Proteobacteria bacterium]|nr:hypothetical protein [Pseudomonadota bacterium]